MVGAPLCLIPVQLMQEHSLVRSLGSTEGLQKLLTEESAEAPVPAAPGS